MMDMMDMMDMTDRLRIAREALDMAHRWRLSAYWASPVTSYRRVIDADYRAWAAVSLDICAEIGAMEASR